MGKIDPPLDIFRGCEVHVQTISGQIMDVDDNDRTSVRCFVLIGIKLSPEKMQC